MLVNRIQNVMDLLLDDLSYSSKTFVHHYLDDFVGGRYDFLMTGLPVFFVIGGAHRRIDSFQIDAGDVNRRPNRN